MSAGDLERNLGTIITKYMSTQKEDLRIASRFSAIASKGDTLYELCEDNRDSNHWMYMHSSWVETCEELREYCEANRDVIERIHPELKGGPMSAFLTENPYDVDDDEQEHDYIDYMVWRDTAFFETIRGLWR